MADSENSRTLPKLTRRDVLIGATATLDLPAATVTGLQPSTPTGAAADPVVRLWRQWRVANACRRELCYRQQLLETALINLRKSKPEAKRDIVAAKRQHQKAKQEEIAAIDTEDELASTLLETTATSIIGAIAKLHSLIETQDPGVGLRETPWPELRSILADLLRIDARVTTA